MSGGNKDLSLVERLRQDYTRVVQIGGECKCFLQIDHQEFCVVDNTDEDRAQWYSLMLAKALARMINTELKKQAPINIPSAPLREEILNQNSNQTQS